MKLSYRPDMDKHTAVSHLSDELSSISGTLTGALMGLVIQLEAHASAQHEEYRSIRDQLAEWTNTVTEPNPAASPPAPSGTEPELPDGALVFRCAAVSSYRHRSCTATFPIDQAPNLRTAVVAATEAGWTIHYEGPNFDLHPRCSDHRLIPAHGSAETPVTPPAEQDRTSSDAPGTPSWKFTCHTDDCPREITCHMADLAAALDAARADRWTVITKPAGPGHGYALHCPAHNPMPTGAIPTDNL